MHPKVSVIHLIWIPYGIQLFKEFVDSYLSFSSGYKHELILLFNGITEEKEADSYHRHIQQAGINYHSYYYKTGQDLEAYRWIAGQLSSDYILFVNSYSRFLGDNWLQKFVQASGSKNAELIGATGSWQSYYSSIFETYTWRWEIKIPFQNNIRKYKLMLKSFFLWRFYFKPFPNPHLRTNGIFINRMLFLSIQFQNPQVKLDAYRIESGRRSITQQLLKKGFKILLIDRFGNTYEKDHWYNTKIFWNSNQEHLLIADNQTDMYANADLGNKKLLEKLAWGPKALP